MEISPNSEAREACLSTIGLDPWRMCCGVFTDRFLHSIFFHRDHIPVFLVDTIVVKKAQELLGVFVSLLTSSNSKTNRIQGCFLQIRQHPGSAWFMTNSCSSSRADNLHVCPVTRCGLLVGFGLRRRRRREGARRGGNRSRRAPPSQPAPPPSTPPRTGIY